MRFFFLVMKTPYLLQKTSFNAHYLPYSYIFFFSQQNFDLNDEVDLDSLISGLPALRIHPSPGYYDLTIQQQTQQLEDEYKEEYIKPDRVPYNKNMARQFPSAQAHTLEELKKKRNQAEASRLSRDRNKYYRSRMEQDIEILTKVLEGHMKRLANIENFTNDFFKRNNLPPFDWTNVWSDEQWENEASGQVIDSGCSSGTGSDRNTESEDYDDDDEDDDRCIDEDNRSEEEEDLDSTSRYHDSDEYMYGDEDDSRYYNTDSSDEKTLIYKVSSSDSDEVGGSKLVSNTYGINAKRMRRF